MNMNESFKECKKIIWRLNDYNVENVRIRCGFGNHFDLVVNDTSLISDAKIDVIHVLLHGMINGIITYRNQNSPYRAETERWKD